MFVCRTLDYIVNTDLHVFLFVKFDYAKNKGIKVNIELTEPIVHLPINSKEYIEIIGILLNNAFEIMAGHIEKELDFCMFYANEELHLIIKYPAFKEYSERILDKKLKKYKNVEFYSTNEKTFIMQHLVERISKST